MSRILEVVIYCVNSSNCYKAYFEEKQPGEWYGTRTEKMKPLFLLEPMSLKSRAKQNNDGSSVVKPSSVLSINKTTEKTTVRGAFYSGAHSCPFCGNTGWVKCGVCHEWTCHKDGETQFRCAHCGNSGEVSGTMDSASGELSQGSNGKFTLS